MRARNAAPSGALGNRDDVDGQAGAVGEALHPLVHAHAAAGRDDSPAAGAGDASIMRRVTKPAASKVARRTRPGRA